MLPVEHQRALRGQWVDGGACGPTTLSTGCIGRNVGQGPVLVPRVGGDDSR